jgi:ribonuclease R
MHELFEVLGRRRHRRGSIDFDLPEPEIVLGPEGEIEAVIAAERNVAHRIIEEFMLLANETVARHLEQAGIPAVYRVHDAPDPVKVREFEAFIGTLGYSLAAPPSGPRPRHFQRLVEQMRGRPEERAIAFLMLRTMTQARYDKVNGGHFGLAAPTYTHFTSPIRRYPDLVVHRLLREVRRGPVTESRHAALEERLPAVARQASDRERRAVEAERELVQWKKVRFMADKVGEEFDGYVTAVSAFGFFVGLVEHFVEGLVHVSSMADDYYRYEERAHTLRGENMGKSYRLGDRVRVQVARVDLDLRRIDFVLVGVLEASRARRPHRARRREATRQARAGRPRHGARQTGRAAGSRGRGRKR